MNEQPDDERPEVPDLPEQNPHGFGALSQGSEIPLGWKPTPDAPVPVMRCTQIKKDGERCGRWSLRGSSNHKCIKHNGNGGFPNVQARAEAIIEAGRMRLLDSSDLAIDTIEQLMQPGTAEAIRLKASTEVLDRVGIRGGFDVNVEVEVTESPADEIRKRLSDLAKGAEASRELAAKAQAADPDIVDAEIVSHDDDQPSLFDMPESSDDDDA